MRSHFLNAVTPPVAMAFQGRRDPLGAYDAFLASYYHWRGRDVIRRPGQFIVGDSGGYSVATQGAVLDPEEVIRWQIANTDVGYILDKPPFREASPRASGRPADYWAHSLDYTVLNVRQALRLYDPGRTAFRWWGIVQGETPEEQEEWFHAVSDVYQFIGEGEGWAMRPHPNNDLGAVARCVNFAETNGIRNLHLLQTTSARSVSILLGLAEFASLNIVTFDSASPTYWATRNRCLIRPRDLPVFRLHPISELSRYGQTQVRDYMLGGECDCQGCTWYREDGLAAAGRSYAHYMAHHNHCLMQDNFKAIAEAALDDPERLIREAIGPRAAGAVFRVYEAAA